MFKFTLLLVASILSAVTAHADNFAPSDLLYRGEPVTMCYTVVPPICITNGIVWKPRNWNPAIIPLGLEQFDATFEGFISQGGPPAPFSFDGTITFDIPGHTSDSQAGVFPFTVTQFDFTDGGALRIRESPTLASTGQTTVQPGGGYGAPSFFDIFTEISLDGGNTWAPSIGAPSHFESTPEPATMLLCGGVLILLGRTIRRRRNRG